MTSERIVFWAAKTSRVSPPDFGLSSRDGPWCPKSDPLAKALPTWRPRHFCREFDPRAYISASPGRIVQPPGAIEPGRRQLGVDAVEKGLEPPKGPREAHRLLFQHGVIPGSSHTKVLGISSPGSIRPMIGRSEWRTTCAATSGWTLH